MKKAHTQPHITDVETPAHPHPEALAAFECLDDTLLADCFQWLQSHPRNQLIAQAIDTALPTLNYHKKLQQLASSSQLQDSTCGFMQLYSDILSHSIEQLTIHGLDKLSAEQPYIFISNHRDVVLDPLLINTALMQKGLPVARCAIGSNLLDDLLLGTYLRLSGCFVVPRDNKPMREMLKALQALSGHIKTLSSDHNIWIAQREGRAKDGLDITNPALIKMLLLARDKQQDIDDYLASRPIVPVSISYEWDPSDLEKAQEQALRERAPNAPFRSDSIAHLLNSLTSPKGRIDLVFGEPLNIHKDDSAAGIAEKIDTHIQSHFSLSASHRAAWKTLHNEPLNPDEQTALMALKQRQETPQSEEVWDKLLALYANVAKQYYQHSPANQA